VLADAVPLIIMPVDAEMSLADESAPGPLQWMPCTLPAHMLCFAIAITDLLLCILHAAQAFPQDKVTTGNVCYNTSAAAHQEEFGGTSR